MWESRVLRRAFERLELHEGKLSRAVLGEGVAATSPPYPTGEAAMSPCYPTWFGQGLLTRPSSSTDGLPVPERRCVTWRPTIGRTAGSGDPARPSYRQNMLF